MEEEETIRKKSGDKTYTVYSLVAEEFVVLLVCISCPLVASQSLLQAVQEVLSGLKWKRIINGPTTK